jgi:hypothetical protein
VSEALDSWLRARNNKLNQMPMKLSFVRDSNDPTKACPVCGQGQGQLHGFVELGTIFDQNTLKNIGDMAMYESTNHIADTEARQTF